MTETLFDFEYELPSGTIITVNAKHTPGLPERKPSLDHAGCPADEGEMEIVDCEVAEIQDGIIDFGGLWFFKTKGSLLQTSINQDIEEEAWDALENE